MSGFKNKAFTKNDEYMTPKYAWEDIQHLIPNQIIWESFYGDGNSGKYLEELGFNVIHEPIDFFIENKGDIIITNPPFSMCKKVLERLVVLNKPFICILPSSKINTQYFRKIFREDKNNPIQIIIPRKRINFVKSLNGKIVSQNSSCNFDCFYYCWKIGLDRDITWLD